MSEKTMQPGKIYQVMTRVMADIGVIGKDRKNVQQNYMFRGIDDLYCACQGALVKHGVFCTPEVLDMKREERATKNGGVMAYTILTVKYTFFADDGSSVETIVTGEGADSGDKSCNKALSGAQKYAFFQCFCIPTEEPKDSENDSPEFTAKIYQKLLDDGKKAQDKKTWYKGNWAEISQLSKEDQARLVGEIKSAA